MRQLQKITQKCKEVNPGTFAAGIKDIVEEMEGCLRMDRQGQDVEFEVEIQGILVTLRTTVYPTVPATAFADEHPAHCDPVVVVSPDDLHPDLLDEIVALDERWYFEDRAFEAAERQTQEAKDQQADWEIENARG